MKGGEGGYFRGPAYRKWCNSTSISDVYDEKGEFIDGKVKKKKGKKKEKKCQKCYTEERLEDRKTKDRQKQSDRQ